MLGSRIKILGDAIVAVLNNDTDLAARQFVLRKKPYNRGRTWVAGGRVVPLQTSERSNGSRISSKIKRMPIFHCRSEQLLKRRWMRRLLLASFLRLKFNPQN